jgi:hypothetical protein
VRTRSWLEGPIDPNAQPTEMPTNEHGMTDDLGRVQFGDLAPGRYRFTVLLGNAPGRQDRQQITMYKSLGIVAQDLFAAEHVLSKARKAGKGTLVEFP